MVRRWVFAVLLGSFAIACGSSEGDTSGGSGGSGGNGGGSGASTGGSASGSSPGGSGGSMATGGTAGSAGTAGSGGSVATGGASGNTGSGGSAGTGGSAGASAQCPESPPSDGSPCVAAGQACHYQDCAGAGLTTAQCVSASWVVETSACDTFLCSGAGDECSAGQICSIMQGGAIFSECVENPCGTGPVTCACAAPSCPGGCNVIGYAGGGITVTCNTCPQGACP